MKRPFLGIGISFAIGIIVSYYFKMDMIISFALFFVTLLLYVYSLYKYKNSLYFIMPLFVVLGMFLSSYNLSRSILIDNIERPLDIEAVVERVLYQDEINGKYILNVNNINLDGNKNHIDEKTILKIIGEYNLEIGDKINFRGSFRIPMENTNPKLYNYRENLISKNIYTNVTIKPMGIYNLYSDQKNSKYRLRIAFRNTVESTFDKHLNEDNSDLIKGIILGDSTYLDEEYLAAYREIGLAHILAVSGLHIGIIAGAMVFFLSRLGLNRKWNIIITITMIWVYGYAIGFPASILRANIMFSLLFIAGIMAEPYDSINSLFLSFWLLLLFQPLSILSVGFQLSYIATFSLLYFSPKVRNLFYPYKNKIVYTVSALIGIYIGILPIQIYYFNGFSLISIISNIIIAPIISFVLILGVALLFTNFIFSPIAALIGIVINISLNIQSFLVGILYNIRFLSFHFASPNILEIILYYIIIFILFKTFEFSSFKRDLNIVIYIYLIALVFWTFGIQISDQKLQVDFIDVGQGDSSLIKTRSGNYLVDTGGNLFDDFDVAKSITLPYLQKHGVNKLKGVFITHFHLDHCKGIPLLMENIDIENIFISYNDFESEIYNYILDGDIPVILLENGDKFKLDKNTLLTVLGPSSTERDRENNANNLSLVFNLSYYDRYILFTGDAEAEAERLIEDRLERNVDILKVGHHGSITSSTDEFLNKVKPDIAIISAGRNNLYGHPHDDIIERFENLKCDIYRTDTMGMTRVILDRDKLYILPFINEINREKYLIEIAFVLIYYLISYIFIKSYMHIGLELNKFEI